MENNLEEENAIDLETLQAQIDLSMSFAQDMVSSWVKNKHNLPSRPRDTDTELKEYLKRPPRLGVGAAVPDNSMSSRDVARLKGQLSDKKRQREDELQVKKEASDDEGESRGGAIKKKARVDPFQVGGKKNKDKNPLAPPPKAIPHSTSTVKSEPQTTEVAPESVPKVPLTPKKADKPKTNNSPFIPTSLPPLDLSPTDTPTSPTYARRLAQSAELLKHPVLNLDEPDTDGDASDDNVPDDPSEHKKKRKRRKKKKKHSIS